MTKIKILGALIFIISIILAILFNNINNQNTVNTNLIKTINQQKAFTQEISKNIFYISKNRDASVTQLNNSIKQFLLNMEKRDDKLDEISSLEVKKQSKKIMLLWNKFYILVQNFKDQKKVTMGYSNIVIEKTVKDIYNTNLKLILEFDKLLKISKEYMDTEVNMYKYAQFTLFFLLVLLLVYLFTQLQSILLFIQKFLHTSKNIRTNSSIKDLKPIDIDNQTTDISKATNNFNYLVENINKSLEYSTDLMTHSYESLNIVEKNIEDLMKLIDVMEGNREVGDELNKKEDALIQSLEEITSSSQKLKNLKKDLDNLILHYKK